MEMKAAPVVVEQTFTTSTDAVWKAVTDKDQMRKWFFETMDDFQPEPGFETQFNVRADDKDYLHLWRVTEVVPKKRIVYNWRYGGYPGDSFVEWDLLEAANGTTLKLTHKGHETFSQEEPVFSRKNCEGAWHYFICERLKAFLERQVS